MLQEKQTSLVLRLDGGPQKAGVGVETSRLKATNLPVILTESYLDSEQSPCVLGDNSRRGTRQLSIGYQQMKEILAPDHCLTGIIAISDKTAMGAMEAIQEAGLRIPDDIAIASIDNIAESAYCRPPLTTVHIPKREIGVLAFQRLHHLISNNHDIPVKNIVYSELIVCESSGAVRCAANT